MKGWFSKRRPPRGRLRIATAAGFGAWGVLAAVEGVRALMASGGWDAASKIGLVCATGVVLCITICGLLLARSRGARRAGLWLATAYVVCWMATAIWGVRDVEPSDSESFARQFGLQRPGPELARIEVMPDFRPHAETARPGTKEPIRAPGSFYAAAPVPVLPFLVKLNYAYSLGPLQGEGGTEYHVWVFGLKRGLATRVLWEF